MSPIKVTNQQYPGPREEWVDDVGLRMVGVHPENDECREHGCALHNPSDHEYALWPLKWDKYGLVFVRLHPCGEGSVLDPDEVAFRARHDGKSQLPTEDEMLDKIEALKARSDREYQNGNLHLADEYYRQMERAQTLYEDTYETEPSR